MTCSIISSDHEKRKDLTSLEVLHTRRASERYYRLVVSDNTSIMIHDVIPLSLATANCISHAKLFLMHSLEIETADLERMVYCHRTYI
jgi:hypothetical protein